MLLVVARLTVRSSYRENREEPADGPSCDTVQFYLPGGGAPSFRIRTYAADHDIHVHGLGPLPDDPVAFVRDSIARTYGDVTASVYEVPIRQRSTDDLVAAGITEGHLELADEFGFAFWNPDGGSYSTKSQPPPPGLREVVYLGGIARFWLPESWRVEMSVDEGGCFYHPESDGVLRLNVLTFDTSAATGPPNVRRRFKEGERPVDGGRLPNGCEFDVYELDTVEDGEPTRLRFWQIAQILPGQCRIYVFSYAYPASAEADVAAERDLVDHAVRRMVPYPEPV